MEKYPESEMAKFAEYCLMSLNRTKKRSYVPSRNEIIACLVSVTWGNMMLMIILLLNLLIYVLNL